ncbi:MAG: hypothetical protein HY544_02455 [Candidatus Diapherotrites archaeon]|uniref:50S ribosomal protein L1 n=1 Tax=Candidatus Iainarchaeum sp. TaxID=3101447 RepID=A0A8T3YJZ5_9ARCH|nr:hypothetical protein [Candidatus Diapherotrites archaeon]
MDSKQVLQALQYAKALSKKRKFEQSIEMVLNFKGIDFKKAESRIDLDVRLPHATGRQAAVKSLVFVKDPNFAEEIKGKATRIIMDADIPALKKKDVDMFIRDYNVFLAEGASILAVAKHLGQQLAPKGRMPKPIQPSVASLEQALRSVSTYTKITNKKGKFMPVIHAVVGKESFKENEVAENIMEIYNAVVNAIPAKEGGIKSVYVKLTMGKPIKVGEKYAPEQSQNAQAMMKGGNA